MVLGSQDDRFHPRCADCCSPLIGIELCGVKKLRGVVPVAPLGICEGVHSEMYKSIKFELMPFELPFARNDRRRALYILLVSLFQLLLFLSGKLLYII